MAFDLHSIPGYTDAVHRERVARESAFLNLPFLIDGIAVNQLTPHNYGLLSIERNAFIVGGIPEWPHAKQFIWALSPEFSRDTNLRDTFCDKLQAEHDFADLVEGIEEFLDVTFLDAPYGSSDGSAPLFCNTAYIEYRMCSEPFRWKRKRALHTSLRITYQLMRAKRWDDGDKALVNRWSDGVRDAWLNSLNAKKEGEGNG